ncbi:MAG: histidine triad nucleotide-binding protein [Mariprofundus sp.]|nr:histidine triad nucleotide-binding protein [Mariprofundus sp.]
MSDHSSTQHSSTQHSAPDCLFCKIIAGDIPCNKVYEDDNVLAFHDIHPKAPSHVLVIPKQHITTLADCDDPALLGLLMDRVKYIADNELALSAGYRVIINVREGGGQEVFHLHAHILGGKKLPF